MTIHTRPSTRKAARRLWHLVGGSLLPVPFFFVTQNILQPPLVAVTELLPVPVGDNLVVPLAAGSTMTFVSWQMA